MENISPNLAAAPSPAAIDPTFLDRVWSLAGRFSFPNNRAIVRNFLTPEGGPGGFHPRDIVMDRNGGRVGVVVGVERNHRLYLVEWLNVEPATARRIQFTFEDAHKILERVERGLSPFEAAARVEIVERLLAGQYLEAEVIIAVHGQLIKALVAAGLYNPADRRGLDHEALAGPLAAIAAMTETQLTMASIRMSEELERPGRAGAPVLEADVMVGLHHAVYELVLQHAGAGADGDDL